MATQVKCPVCTQAVVWSEASAWRPFCSERCKLIDLGDWAAQRHVIAGNAVENSENDFSSSQAESPPSLSSSKH